MRKLHTLKSFDILCLFSLIALVILIVVFILCLFLILPTVPSFLSNPDTVKLSQNYIFWIGTFFFFLRFRTDAITRLYNHHQLFHHFIFKKTLFLFDSLVSFVTIFSSRPSHSVLNPFLITFISLQ